MPEKKFNYDKFNCLITSRYRDEVLISQDKRQVMTEVDALFTLTIKDLKDTDDAEYMATAVNTVGKVSTYAEVLVNPAPVPGWWFSYQRATLLNHMTPFITPLSVFITMCVYTCVLSWPAGVLHHVITVYRQPSPSVSHMSNNHNSMLFSNHNHLKCKGHVMHVVNPKPIISVS